MDNFDLRKLSIDRDRLSRVLRAYVEMQSSTAFMVSRDDLLKIFGYDNGRKYNSASTIAYLTVVTDYQGEEDRAYFKPAEAAKKIVSSPTSVLSIPSYAQPLGWSDDLMDKSIKDKDGVSVDPQQLRDALGYLLRLDLDKAGNPDFCGVYFQNNEALTTDGRTVLVQGGLPTITQTPKLMSYDCAVAIYSILRSPYVESVQMGVTKSGLFGTRVELDDGTEMFFWSKVRFSIPDFKDPRPPLDARAVGFVVHNAFLEPILTGTIEQVKDAKKRPVVYFYTTQTGLAYMSYEADDLGLDPPRGIYQGEIPMTRSTQSQEDIAICVRADNLLQAVKGMGESAQFIIPYHPLLGLQVHPIDPFYVNCNQSQFALLAPFILEREKVAYMEKLKRKANNAMES